MKLIVQQASQLAFYRRAKTEILLAIPPMYSVCGMEINMKDDNCIFCKLANGDIPTNTLYEDDMFRVIFDMSPATKGHALIIPKNHYRNIYDIDSDVASKVFPLASKLAKVMTDTFGADGFNVVQNNEEIAGQSVFHFHMHLIPRYKGDNAIKLWTPGESDQEELAKMAEEIRNNL